MGQTGRLSDWDDDKGFGFITPASGGPRVFVHISAFPRGRRRPRVADKVRFTLASNGGKPRAASARLTAARTPRKSIGAPLFTLVLVTVFFAMLLALVVGRQASAALPALYLVMSVVAFVTYGRDKAAARQGRRRIPEATLHLLDLLGGWPGGLVAQRAFRHKTRKVSFQLGFWCAVVANCAGLIWLLLAVDVATLRASFGVG